MVDTCRIIKVFLASPGDLGEERILVKDAEREINRTIGEYLGVRVEIKGWEDTLSGIGRPQATINKELDSCELFIGLMWRKWGTPPSANNEYSSGFEEEFDRAIKAFREIGSPDMALYFKNIDERFLTDPGEDLKKVLEFKKQVESNREILYEIFDDPYELQKKVRVKISDYIIGLKEAEEDKKESYKERTKDSRKKDSGPVGEKKSRGIFSKESYDFLKEFLLKSESVGEIETVTPFEVARFRLLSGVVSRSENDTPIMGVHDSNILFSRREEDFGEGEVSSLLDAGLRNISSENVPIWHWCYRLDRKFEGKSLLQKSLLLSQEEVVVGALKAMTLVGCEIPEAKGISWRNPLIAAWLSDDVSEDVKNSALQYLKVHGVLSDIDGIVEEWKRGSTKTSRTALEAIVGIQIRYNEREAVKTVFENTFEYFDGSILKSALKSDLDIDGDVLELGLSHKNREVRLESFRRLVEKGCVDSDKARELWKDPDPRVRLEAVLLSMNEDGTKFSDREIKDILVDKKSGASLLGLSDVYGTSNGEVEYQYYLFSKCEKMKENELMNEKKYLDFFSGIPYFSFYRRFFKKYKSELRRDIDDNYREKFSIFISRLKKIGLDEKNLRSLREMEDNLRGEILRRACDVLCEKMDYEDLYRIREVSRIELVKSSYQEVGFLRKYGEWEDVPFLVNFQLDHRSFHEDYRDYTADHDHWSFTVAEAACSMSKGKDEELFGLDMPPPVLSNLVRVFPSSRYSRLSDSTVFSLLNNPNDRVRKNAAIKSVLSFSNTKLKTLLSSYLAQEGFRYYNVIVWLDFGISSPKRVTKEAISRMESKLFSSNAYSY